MAGSPDGAPRAASLREDWPHLVFFGSRFLAVAGVLLLAAVLRSEPLQKNLQHPAPPSVPPGEGPGPRAPLRSDVPLQLVPAPDVAEPRAASQTEALLDRASADLGRLASADPGWTAQLLLLCDVAKAGGVLDDFGGHPSLYVLPVMHQDMACFRIGWGRYATREAAKQAADLPAALRAIQPDVLPKRISEVLE